MAKIQRGIDGLEVPVISRTKVLEVEKNQASLQKTQYSTISYYRKLAKQCITRGTRDQPIASKCLVRTIDKDRDALNQCNSR